ncbi:MAG: hypothetical protein IPG63_09655 [Xanthomonadales bacterium]|nr:hypothetical protein [Xanthomonadales bacterium]
MPTRFYQESLIEMDRALDALSALVRPPRAVPFKDSFVYRYVEQLPEQAIVQKLARLPSGLRAAHLLLDAGLFQEQAALQRLIDEIGEDITFLSIPRMYGGETSLHTEYLQAFFAEEFDPATGLPTAQDRPMVRRKKIRAYIAQSPIGTPNPSGHIGATRTLSKAYSGYVHAASPQIMDMYGGDPPRFHTRGMSGTPREAEHRQDIANYFYRSVSAFAIAARALGHQPLFDHLFAHCCEYEAVMGIRE